MKLKLLIALALLALCGGANAGEYNAIQVASACSGELDKTDISFCEGLLQGVVSGHDTLITWGYLKEPVICVPGDIDTDRLAKIFVGYVAAHIERQNHTASSLAMNAFKQAFPCK